MARPFIVKADNYRGYFKTFKNAAREYSKRKNNGANVMLGNRMSGRFVRNAA